MGEGKTEQTQAGREAGLCAFGVSKAGSADHLLGWQKLPYPAGMPESSENPHHFEFDLDRGIRLQAVEKLEKSPPLQLAKDVGPKASGVYALYHHGKLVYVGKASKGTTKSKRTLRARLNEHLKKISTRKNITPKDVSCRYLTFNSEWWVFAAEFALINHYEPEWNASGFGSKVPGKGRPGTTRISRWDDQFPLR